MGVHIRHLSFLSCNDIDILELLPCVQLKCLQFERQSSLKRDESALESGLTAETFLPQLEVFESNFCLGKRSRLFEEKSSLTGLDVWCSHIGTEASNLNWNVVARIK